MCPYGEWCNDQLDIFVVLLVKLCIAMLILRIGSFSVIILELLSSYMTFSWNIQLSQSIDRAGRSMI